MYNLKRSSSLWINDNNYVSGKFSWQEGFGAFSVNENEVQSKVKYIENQKEHHKKVFFRDEYIKSLNDNGIDYDEKYIFKALL